MSGGHFHYNQNYIKYFIEELENVINNNDNKELDGYGDYTGYFFNNEVLKQFEEGLYHLKIAYIYAQGIDWLVSGDDGEESFLKRLEKDLDEYKNEYKI